jgi:hypothetical protein
MFKPILMSFGPPSACIESRHGSRGVGSWVGSMDGLSSPYTILWVIAVCRGDRTSPRGAAWSCCNSACREEEASRDIVISWWLCPLLVPVHEISQGKWILTGQCFPPRKVMML